MCYPFIIEELNTGGTLASLNGLRDTKLLDMLAAVKVKLEKIAGSGVRFMVYGSYARGEERADSDVDLMVVLPDGNASFAIENEIRDVIYDAGFEMDKIFSVMVVSESQAEKYSGFMVFGSVEREGVAI